MFRKISIFLCTILFAGMSQAQCVGTFGLTRSVHGFVTSFGNKWINWLVFLVFVIVPVYGLAILVDAVVLNSIQFWTGRAAVRADFDENGESRSTLTDVMSVWIQCIAATARKWSFICTRAAS